VASDPVFTSSDLNALRPYWARLHQQSSFFANLAPELQVNALADAVEQDHPATAAAIRQWIAATRRAMVAALDQAGRERPRRREAVLWWCRKGRESFAA